MSTATHSIDVNAPISRAYDLWRDFENWPKFIPHLKEVHDTGELTAQCYLATPLGRVECHLKIINVHPGESFQWTTTSGTVEFAGKVSLEKLGESSTRVTVNMEYHAPMGIIGETLAKWLHEDPCADLPSELERFKQLVESGSAAKA